MLLFQLGVLWIGRTPPRRRLPGIRTQRAYPGACFIAPHSRSDITRYEKLSQRLVFRWSFLSNRTRALAQIRVHAQTKLCPPVASYLCPHRNEAVVLFERMQHHDELLAPTIQHSVRAAHRPRGHFARRTASSVSLVAGGSQPRPCKISLAQHGVLYLGRRAKYRTRDNRGRTMPARMRGRCVYRGLQFDRDVLQGVFRGYGRAAAPAPQSPGTRCPSVARAAPRPPSGTAQRHARKNAAVHKRLSRRLGHGRPA